MGTNLGVLASLMQTMTPQMPGYDPLQVQQQRTANQTGLITLADLKAKQAAEAAMFEQIKNDPEVARRIFGDSAGPVLGSLMQPQAQAGAGAITQSPLGGGLAQQIPAYPDASRYAGVSPQGGGPLPGGVGMPTVTSPQSTIASLGPAGQPQMQAPRNPVLEMARTDPRAAMLLQQQMQGAQEQRWKTEERRLDMGVKVAEGVARELYGVKDQETLDAARERIRQYHPQAAAQVPQFYSKEAVESLQQRGIAIKDMALWRLNMAKADKERMETSLLPELFKDASAGRPPQAPTDPTTSPASTPARGTVPGIENLSPQFRTKADSIADRLGANREDFYRVMHFETGGEMSPATTNRAGSGATGLIQFMPETAKRLGTTTEALAKMTPEQQLDYVERYLEPYKGKIGNLKDLYMAILYPAAVGKAEDTVLFSPDKAPAAYRQNAGLDAGKKGYVTVGDAVAAVERTTGGRARGTTATSGTGTAQAPPLNPRVAQLDTMIDQGTQKAKQAAALGYESLAAQYNNDVQRLQHERDRLDAPRQEFLKKQAVQDLELQQKREEGLARAQLEADTKPATNAEIDAINRGLPREKQLSYGTTYKDIREKKLVGGGTLDPTVTKDIINTTTAIQQFEELNNAVTQLPTGPLTQYVEQFKERWGIDISDEKVAQRAILAGAQSQLLNARSGTAVSPSEYTRLMNELPNEGNDPKVFKARLANTLRQFKNIYKTRVQVLRKLGHAIPDDLMEPLAAPEGAPVAKPSTTVDKARDIMKPR